MTDFPENLNFGLSVEDTLDVVSSYNGKNPPSNLLMPGVLKRMYLTRDSNKAPMLKVLYVSNHPDYDGFPAWENVSLTKAAAFKWKALCEDVLNVTIEDLNSRMHLERDEENHVGVPVSSIGDRVMDGEHPIMFSVGYRPYTDDAGNETRQTRVHMVFMNDAE